VGLEDARVLAGRLPEGTIEDLEDPEKPGRLRGNAAGGQCLEMLPGTLAEPGAIRSVVSPEELQEPDGLSQVKLRLLDRERRGHLLVGRKSSHSLGNGDREEAIGDERCGVGRERLQDGEAFLHPCLLLPQASEDGVDGEFLLGEDVLEEIEFLAECGVPGRVIEPEAVKLCLGSRPGLLDDPRLLLSPGLQGEEPLEAVDEEEPAAILDDDEGVIVIGVGGERQRREEFGGDGGEGDFPDVAHGRSAGIAFA
jgi:hypothetical protein